MTYNLTNITNANGLPDIAIAVNDMTGGLYGSFLLYCLFMVLFLSLKGQNDTVSVMLVASFATTLVGALLLFIGLIGWVSLSVMFVLLVASILIAVWRD
jgi:hypothetical protein